MKVPVLISSLLISTNAFAVKTCTDKIGDLYRNGYHLGSLESILGNPIDAQSAAGIEIQNTIDKKAGELRLEIAEATTICQITLGGDDAAKCAAGLTEYANASKELGIALSRSNNPRNDLGGKIVEAMKAIYEGCRR